MDMIVGVESEWWRDSSRLRQSVFICLVVATSILMNQFSKQKGLSYNELKRDMKFGLRIVASIQHVGGGGGGGIFVPMLTLIISGFDSKSSTTLSKCKY
uniref:Uncharacterized protein n=1 Tax=Salix viminalis TaxID=40686 RepID=A0A6N2NBR8_SALVM